MNFQYKIRNPQGKIITGMAEATNRSQFIRELTSRGFHPIAVVGAPSQKKGVPELIQMPEFSSSIKVKKRSWLTLRLGKSVKDQDILSLTRDLLSLTHAGIPIVSGLSDIKDQVSNAYMREILEEMREAIAAGVRLSETLEKYPKVFSQFYRHSIRAGEESGKLEFVLERLADSIDRQIEIRMLIKDAIRYPRLVLCFLAGAFAFIMSYVIPKISSLFLQFGAVLPLPTRILIALSGFVQQFGLPIIIVVAVFITWLQLFKKSKVGKPIWDGLKLRLPVFGRLIQLASLKEFASSLQTLHASGIVLPEGLKISAGVVDNEVIASAILAAQKEVLRGKALSQALFEQKIFPPFVIRIVTIGETAGNLDKMLGEVVYLYERDIRYTAKSITTMIEPMLTVVLGFMVLVFALGVFLPMWQGLRLFMPK